MIIPTCDNDDDSNDDHANDSNDDDCGITKGTTSAAPC